MKASIILPVLSASVAVTASPRAVKPRSEVNTLIQLSETEQRWVTESEIRDLRLVSKVDFNAFYIPTSKVEFDGVSDISQQGVKFFDRTYAQSTASSDSAAAVTYSYPTNASHTSSVTPLFSSLSAANLESTLTTFSTFQNRFYKGGYGANSSAWLLQQVNATIAASGLSTASVAAFPHPDWEQDSIIATIPGKTAQTIVIGAHQDSVNWQSLNQKTSRAPGADDNGSGSMTILESLRVYLTSPEVLAGEAENTVEFHWYAAEEAGLLGSQAVFEAYAAEGRDVVAMLEQDMTGYSAGMEVESLGVVTDYVDAALTSFIEMIVDTYCDIPYAETQCGYAWSVPCASISYPDVDLKLT